MGVSYINHEYSINYLDGLTDVEVLNDGYIAVGSSNFRNSKDVSKKVYTHIITETGKEERIIANQAKLVKYNKDLEIVWERTFDCKYDSSFNDVIKVDDGYVAVGKYYAYSQIDLHTTDGLIVKYDLNGNMLWYKNYQILGDTSFTKVIESNGNYVVVGQSIYENLEVGNHTNGGGVIVSYDKSELDSIERELKEVKRDILVRENQLIRSQYDRLLEVVVELENNINIVKRKLNDEGMLKVEDKLLVVINNINEINDGLNEVEAMLSNFGGRINSDESKLIDDAFGYLKFKISDAEVVLNNNRNDSRYEKLSSDIANCKERLYDLSGKSKKNRPLKVKFVKSGKKLLEKHNKLLLVSAGLIALTLLLRKFLLIPSIMHANVILGTANPSLLATTEFFNKILGGMIGARLNSSGIWFMSNGMMLTSSVATTSLLKGLVVGFTGTAVSLVPVLIIAIKELVEKMKIKERKLKLGSKNVMVDEGEKQEESMQQKLFNIKNNIIRGINNLKNDEMNVIDELHNGRSR